MILTLKSKDKYLLYCETGIVYTDISLDDDSISKRHKISDLKGYSKFRYLKAITDPIESKILSFFSIESIYLPSETFYVNNKKIWIVYHKHHYGEIIIIVKDTDFTSFP